MSLIALSAARRKSGMGAVDDTTTTPAGPLDLAAEDTEVLTVAAFNATGGALSLAGRDVRWTTSNAAVATVAKTGLATALVTGVAAGTCSITPIVDSVSGTALSVEVAGAGAAAQLAVETQPAGAAPGEPFSTQPVVRIEDSGGLLITDSTAEVTVAKLSGDGTLSGDTAKNAVDGIATFTDLEIDTAGAHTLRFSSTGLTAADSNSFNVTEPGSPPPLTFWSDWRTATGNTLNALTDGDKWNGDGPSGISDGGTRVSIIAADGLDFPVGMTNVIQGRYRESTVPSGESPTWWVIEHDSGWAVPAIGGTMCKRLYFRHTVIGTHVGDSTMHPVEPQSGGCADEGEWVMNTGTSTTYGTTAADNFLFRFKTKSHNWSLVLDKHETYRVEERWTREDTNTWKTELRIYDSSDTLIKDDSDFVCASHSSHVLSTQGAGERTTTVSVTCLTHQNINYQGTAGNGRGSDDEDNNRIYYGGYAVAISDEPTDWIGAYPHADEA